MTTYTEEYQRKLIEQTTEMNTYICGADGKPCGLSRDTLPYPCQTCKRNKHWKENCTTK